MRAALEAKAAQKHQEGKRRASPLSALAAAIRGKRVLAPLGEAEQAALGKAIGQEAMAKLGKWDQILEEWAGRVKAAGP